MKEQPILEVSGLTKRFGVRTAVRDVAFELWPGEVLGIVGESGSGKTTLLNCVGGRMPADSGAVSYRTAAGPAVDMLALAEAERRRLLRTEWGFVQQHARDGLRMNFSAGANIGERLMALGDKHYGKLRDTALDWLQAIRSTIWINCRGKDGLNPLRLAHTGIIILQILPMKKTR